MSMMQDYMEVPGCNYIGCREEKIWNTKTGKEIKGRNITIRLSDGNRYCFTRGKIIYSAVNGIHQIQIINIKVQRLREISDEDCLLEGIVEYKNGTYGTLNNTLGHGLGFSRKCFFIKPRIAFAYLINAICGKGTWERNSYHVIYYFKLIK